MEALATLPVVMELNARTGLVTKLGTTVQGLGGKVERVGDALSVNLEDSDQVLGGLTTKLSTSLRPVLLGTDGKVTRVAQALVLPAQAGNLLLRSGETPWANSVSESGSVTPCWAGQVTASPAPVGSSSPQGNCSVEAVPTMVAAWVTCLLATPRHPTMVELTLSALWPVQARPVLASATP